MDRNLLERVIKRLEEKDLIDHEYMEAADLESLRSDIAELKSMLPTEETELVGCYCESEDKTFIMKYTRIDGDVRMAECVGWYCGEPTDEDNERFANGHLTATYN